MNYAELTQAIQDYTDNQETTFVSSIPTFVRQAEERIYNSVRIPELRKNATGSVTASNPYLARPDDFLAVLSLAVVDGSGDYSYLLAKEVAFVREAYPSASTTGLPRFYAIFDGDVFAGGAETSSGNFILGPTPDDDYVVELHYFFEPASIIDTTTSWLGDNAENLLLYACLVEAYTFMKGDADLLAEYSTRYMTALQELAALDRELKRDEYRNGSGR